MPAHILVVEDDPAIARGLELNLQLDGHRVSTAGDGRAALERLDETPDVDLVVLDIMLPHVNGYEVVRRLRRSGRDVPVVLISARSGEDDIVLGLDVGADDYVVKPFRVAELLARVKAHLRRRAPVAVVDFGDVEVDIERRLVRRAGEPVALGQREIEVLLFLVARDGRAVTRDAILRAVWGAGYFGTDRTVDNYIASLRQKLDRPGAPRHILTERGVGYRFVADPDA
jgi:DNA-binding response OmpR family regulator